MPCVKCGIRAHAAFLVSYLVMNSLDMNRQVTLCGSNIVADFAFEHQLPMMALYMLMQLTIGGYRIVTFFTFPLLRLLVDTIDVNF